MVLVTELYILELNTEGICSFSFFIAVPSQPQVIQRPHRPDAIFQFSKANKARDGKKYLEMYTELLKLFMSFR